MMLRVCVVVLTLLPLACRAQSTCEATTGCPSDDVALLPASNSEPLDHFYVGGMFGAREEGDSPYTCGKVRERGIVNMEAFFWALKHYSQTVDLGGISVGGFAMDSCSRVERTLDNLYSFETCRTQYTGVTPRNTLAYVGPDKSSEALATAVLLGGMNKTQVSSISTSPQLSMDRYDYFLRTVPSDQNDAMIMVKLLKMKGIKYVVALYQDTAYGRDGFHAFQMYVNDPDMNDDLCIVHSEPLPMRSEDYPSLVQRLNEVRSTRYVALFANAEMARTLLEYVEQNPEIVSGNLLQFIGTSSWGDSQSVVENINVAANAITMSLDTSVYPNTNDVTDFWINFYNMDPRDNDYNPYFRKFWEEQFDCSLTDTTNLCDVDNQDLRDKVLDRDVYVPFTLMAVHAILLGVKQSTLTYCEGRLHLCSNFLNIESVGQKIHEGILGAQDDLGRKFFQDNGDAITGLNRYKVHQVQGNGYVAVYDYDATSDTSFSTIGDRALVVPPGVCPFDPCLECNELPVTTTSTMAPVTTQAVVQTTVDPKAALDAVIALYFERDQEFTGIYRQQNRSSEDSMTRFEIGHKWIIAIGVLAGMGILCVCVFETYILYKLIGTKIGKQWRTMWLGQLLLFSLFLCYLVLFAYLPVPTKATCGITRFGVGVAYAMCFAVLLVKLMVLLTSKSSADSLIPGDVISPNYLRGIYQFLMFIFVVGVQVVISIQWLITVPPDAIQVTANNGELVWICNHYSWTLDKGWSDMSMFVRTEFENHLLSLCYVMALILITTIVAMKAHGIITNHRESVFIGIAAGFSIPVWIAWGLVGGFNKDHAYAQEFGDACIAFGLFITATLILFSMFLPKVRQLVNMGVEGIYFEDDRDTMYAGSVIMAPPSYKSRPNSVYMTNNGYADQMIIGDENTLHLKHPGSMSTYSAPVYTVQRPVGSVRGTGKVLQMTTDLKGKHPLESTSSKRPASEVGYATAGYASYRKSQSDAGGGTLRKSTSASQLGAL